MGFFDQLFRKEKKLAPIDISKLVKTDMHSHLIPGIDDGSKSIEESLSLIRTFKELGYKKIITTPHIMSDYFKNTPDIINEGLAQLRKELNNQKIEMEIEAAAEYYLDFDFIDKIKKEKLLTFGKNYLLLEVSYLNEPDNIDAVIFELQTSGYNVVLAHPERYPFWGNNPNRFETLKDKEVLFQININSLAGHYSPGAKKVAEKLIEMNMVNFIGTDCHHANHLKYLEEALCNPALHKLVESGKLLNHTL
ncbi:MAG TPA: capsular biosynthesis protein [Bacteroidia bacterium]|nr:capsular biosynthesis protein [Bacteroidia bacterium]